MPDVSGASWRFVGSSPLPRLVSKTASWSHLFPESVSGTMWQGSLCQTIGWLSWLRAVHLSHGHARALPDRREMPEQRAAQPLAERDVFGELKRMEEWRGVINLPTGADHHQDGDRIGWPNGIRAPKPGGWSCPRGCRSALRRSSQLSSRKICLSVRWRSSPRMQQTRPPTRPICSSCP